MRQCSTTNTVCLSVFEGEWEFSHTLGGGVASESFPAAPSDAVGTLGARRSEMRTVALIIRYVLYR